MVQSDASFASIQEGNDFPPLNVSASLFPGATAQKPPRNKWVIYLLVVVHVWIAVISLVWITVLLSWASAWNANTWRSSATALSHISDVVRSMPKSLEDPHAQTRACILTWAISENMISEKLVSSDQSHVLKAMEQHPFRSELQQQCLRAIDSSFPTEDFKLLRRDRTLSMVLRAMRNHRDKMEVQVYGTRILSKMPRTMLSDAFGLPRVVMDTLKRFAWHEDIAEHCLDTLARLSDYDPTGTGQSSSLSVRATRLLTTQVDIADAESKSTCSDLGGSQLDLPSKAIAEVMLEILSKEVLGKSSTVETRSQTYSAVWKTLRKFDGPSVTGLAFQLLLGILQRGKEDNSFHGLTSSETDVLLEKMDQYRSDQEIQQRGAKILELFPSAVPKRKVVGVLKEAMRQHENNQEIAESSLTVLTNLDVLDLFHLYNPDGADILLNILWRFQSVDTIQIMFYKLFARYVETSSSFPSSDHKRAEVVLNALDIIARIPSPSIQSDGLLRKGSIQFHLTTMLYFLGNEQIQERCVSALVKQGPIDHAKGFDIVRGAYRSYGSHNSAIRRNALAILEQMGCVSCRSTS